MTIKVIYFPLKGRGLPIRMCLEHGSVPYEYCPVAMEDWPKRKAEFPNGQLPVLEVDGKQICQTAAILDVASEKAGIALKDPMQRAKNLEIFGMYDDIAAMIRPTIHESDAAKATQMRKDLCADDKMPSALKRLEAVAAASSTKEGHCVGSALSTSDLIIMQLVDWFKIIDGISQLMNPKDQPTLHKVHDKVLSMPKLKALYDSYTKQ
eukprot:Selendium_serpulae@DN5961_c0_g1_i4.p1